MLKKTLVLIFFASLLLHGCREDIVEFEDLERDGGSLFINSNPPGASIFFENVNTRLLTPNEFEDIAPREYLVTLKLPGYEDATVVVSIESGMDKFLNIIMRRPTR